MVRVPFSLIVVLLVLIVQNAARADALPVWRDGLVGPNGDAGIIYMSEKGGFGARFGLDVQMVALRGDPIVLKALLAGELESYIGGPASPMVAASKGADLRIVGCGWHKQSYVLLANRSIKTLAEFRGKTIAVSTPGSAPDIFLRAALATVGISPSDVTFVAGGAPSDWLKSMAAGVIDSAPAPDEYTPRALTLGLHAITSSDEATPLSMQRCYFVRGATLRAHPDRVARFLAAEMAAYSYSLAHRSETIALTRQILNASADAPEAVASYDSMVKRNVIELSFEPPMEKLDWLRDVLAHNEMLDAHWDPAAMIDRAPLSEARKLFAAEGAMAEAAAPASLAALGVKDGP
jgi:NitT/TauT family transport system substrate-binding protein